MKPNKIWALLLMMIVVSVLAIAKTTDEQSVRRPREDTGVSAPAERKPAGVPRVVPGRRRNRGDSQQAYRQMQTKQMNIHRREIAELEQIKKIAEEENASRTVEAIQKLIDQKEAQFKQSMEKFENQRHEGFKRFQQQQELNKPAQKEPTGKE